ncbi:multicopper oxidase family protein [Nocardia xishanensis]
MSALGRRGFLALAAAGSGLVGIGVLGKVSCGTSTGPETATRMRYDYIKPTDPEIAAAEAARTSTGNTVVCALAAGPTTIDLGGRLVNTWTYGRGAVAPEIRLSAGDTLAAHITNATPAATSIHWHGIRIRNDMDGVPPVTQDPIAPGTEFHYRFLAPDPGTYWYHSHSGLQADRGLFGALIVEDPADATGADADAVLVLDDWVDGLGTHPDAVLTALNPNLHGGHAGHDAPAAAPISADEAAVAAALTGAGHGDSGLLGGMTQHIAYPLHLINGRPPNDPAVLSAAPGTRLRLRIINAGAETPYRFAIAGHRLTVVAVDGFDVQPAEADTILIGMAQRYDVLVTVTSGAWPVVAAVEGRPGYASTVLRSTDAAPLSTPDIGGAIPELGGHLLLERDLRPAARSVLAVRPADREYSIDLLQAGDRYVWAMAGPDAGRLVMRQGERIRITMHNKSRMWHPMHTHGHTFAVPDYGGLRRDTVNVLPGASLAIEFDADNPGEWMFHCHNAYHFEAGMTANLKYIR